MLDRRPAIANLIISTWTTIRRRFLVRRSHCRLFTRRASSPIWARFCSFSNLRHSVPMNPRLLRSCNCIAAKARISRFTDRNSHFSQVGSRLCRRTIPVYGPTGILSETPVPQRQNDHTANAITGKEMKFPIFPSNDGKICGRPVCTGLRPSAHGVGLCGARAVPMRDNRQPGRPGAERMPGALPERGDPRSSPSLFSAWSRREWR
jgi:hypothetical protein